MKKSPKLKIVLTIVVLLCLIGLIFVDISNRVFVVNHKKCMADSSPCVFAEEANSPAKLILTSNGGAFLIDKHTVYAVDKSDTDQIGSVVLLDKDFSRFRMDGTDDSGDSFNAALVQNQQIITFQYPFDKQNHHVVETATVHL